jgi:hypothetical protein
VSRKTVDVLNNAGKTAGGNLPSGESWLRLEINSWLCDAGQAASSMEALLQSE